VGALLTLPVMQERRGVGNVAQRPRLEVFEVLFPKLLSLLLHAAAEVHREEKIIVVAVAALLFVIIKEGVAVEVRAPSLSEGVAVGEGSGLVGVGKMILEENAVKLGVRRLLHLALGLKSARRLLDLHLLGVARNGGAVRHAEIGVGDAENTLGVIVKAVGLHHVLLDGGGGV